MEKICPARAKAKIPLLAPPAAQPSAALPPYGCGVPLAGAAAPCWLNWRILLQEPSRLAFCPRAAVWWLLHLRGWCRMRKTDMNTHLLQVRTLWRFRRPQAHSGARALRLPSPGGTSNRGRGPLISRFKGMGYLGEGGNRNPPSPRQLFGDFLSAQKVTRPEAKYPYFPFRIIPVRPTI